jgi:hypothetical protein
VWSRAAGLVSSKGFKTEEQGMGKAESKESAWHGQERNLRMAGIWNVHRGQRVRQGGGERDRW